MKHPRPSRRAPDRRQFLAAAAGTATTLGCAAAPSSRRAVPPTGDGPAVLVGSSNALPGMEQHYARLVAGADPLDVTIEVVKLVEANPDDHSVGLGGLPNEDGVVQLDAACMHGPTHNAGSVACLENILHPSEVARLVMERTDHCMLVGRGAYEFARQHGHPHTELLTDEARKIWLSWKETMSDRDDRFPPREKEAEDESTTGTIHCSGRAPNGDLGCTTTTSGLSYKIPGRVGDSPIIGAGLYLDQEAGSAGATGRGEAAILAHGSSAIVELLRAGWEPVDAGLEVLRRVARQAARAARWQPGLVDATGRPNFDLQFYVLAPDGRFAGVSLKGGASFAVATPDGGPRLEPLVALY